MVSPRRSSRASGSGSTAAIGGGYRASRSGSPSLKPESIVPIEELNEDDVSSVKEHLKIEAEASDHTADEIDEIGSTDEITRCVCGQHDAESEGGLMIQCELCSVWQHGPCVGILEDSEVPDIYYCEQCRPELHEFGSRSQK